MEFACRELFKKVSESALRNVNQVRFYPRWSHRRPRKVLLPEEYKDVESKYETNLKQKSSENKNDVNVNSEFASINKNNISSNLNFTKETKRPENVKFIKKIEVITKKKTTTDMLETVIDAQGNFIYTKLKNNDPQVGSILTMVKSRKEKHKQGLALLEGKRVIKEALQAGCLLKYLLFSRKSDVECLKAYLPKSGAKLYKMPYREIQIWSDVTTSPGIMGIFKIPDLANYTSSSECLPLTVICDNIREPGNLGAILRTAAAVGAERILLTKGCVDLWEAKVIRSATGAHFKLQIHTKLDWPSIREQISNCMGIFIADNNIITESNNNTTVEKKNCSTIRTLLESVPVLPYYSLNFSKLSSFILIVGGETEGISEESYQLAAEHKGVRLNIPLNNDVDSLNTGTAFGIIAFEIKRQMMLGKLEAHKSDKTYCY